MSARRDVTAGKLSDMQLIADIDVACMIYQRQSAKILPGPH